MGADLARYVKKALKAGYSESQIRKKLVDNGWSRHEARKAIREAKGQGGVGKALVFGAIAVFLGAVFVSAYFLLTPSTDVGSGEAETPTPVEEAEPQQTERNESTNTSEGRNETSTNETEQSELGREYSTLQQECIAETEKIDKFQCYLKNMPDVSCSLLPPDDSRMCDNAYSRYYRAQP